VKALREISLEQFNMHEAELSPTVAKRCRFILEENDRVLKLAAALHAFDRKAIRQLTAASFRGACDLYEIGAPAMHAMMTAILAGPGVVGARQAGAGFGGCMVAFVEEDAVDAFSAFVRKTYFAATQTQPEVYPVKAAAGAGLLPQTPDAWDTRHRPVASAGRITSSAPAMDVPPTP
jgi:galactokinase